MVLKSFQCHEHKVIEFDQHVSVIIGPSDEGKSSILRALRWAATNQPSGNEFIGRFGQAPYAQVVLHADGRRVGRRRGAKNLYRLDGQIFAAFGTRVPPAISELLNVGEENFQGQHDSPYLLTMSPPEVARSLNDIVNLGLIDRTLTNAAKLVRRTNTEVQVSEERLKQATERKDSYSWGVELDKDVTAAQDAHDRLAMAHQKADSLRQAASDVVNKAVVAQTCRRLSEAILGILKVGQEWHEISGKAIRLRELFGKIRTLTTKVNKLAPDLSELKRMWEAYESARRRQRELNSIALGMSQLNHEIEYATVQLTGLRKEIQKLTGGLCPVCQRQWPSSRPIGI